MMNIKELISNNYCYFDHYRAGFVYYNIKHEGKIYQFPIELDDVGNGTLNNQEKAITLMRWLRMSIKNNQLIELKK